MQTGAFRQRQGVIDATAAAHRHQQLVIACPCAGCDEERRVVDGQGLSNKGLRAFDLERQGFARPRPEGEVGAVVGKLVGNLVGVHGDRWNAVGGDMPERRGGDDPGFDPITVVRGNQRQVGALGEIGTPAQAFRLRTQVDQHLAVLDDDARSGHRFSGQQRDLHHGRYAQRRITTHRGFNPPNQVEDQASLDTQEGWQHRCFGAVARLYAARQLQGVGSTGFVG